MRATWTCPAWAWLRRNGRYLNPAGSRDTGTAVATYLRAWLAIHTELIFTCFALGLLVLAPHLVQHRFQWLNGWAAWHTPWWENSFFRGRRGAQNRDPKEMELTNLTPALALQLGLLGSPSDPVGRFTMREGPSLRIVSQDARFFADVGCLPLQDIGWAVTTKV